MHEIAEAGVSQGFQNPLGSPTWMARTQALEIISAVSQGCALGRNLEAQEPGLELK